MKRQTVESAHRTAPASPLVDCRESDMLELELDVIAITVTATFRTAATANLNEIYFIVGNARDRERDRVANENHPTAGCDRPCQVLICLAGRRLCGCANGKRANQTTAPGVVLYDLYILIAYTTSSVTYTPFSRCNSTSSEGGCQTGSSLNGTLG